jgi:hypothetical protein
LEDRAEFLRMASPETMLPTYERSAKPFHVVVWAIVELHDGSMAAGPSPCRTERVVVIDSSRWKGRECGGRPFAELDSDADKPKAAQTDDGRMWRHRWRDGREVKLHPHESFRAIVRGRKICIWRVWDRIWGVLIKLSELALFTLSANIIRIFF